jgi:predicted acylesterase/phospholipase RssA/CRP-like cAMP-binding protein
MTTYSSPRPPDAISFLAEVPVFAGLDQRIRADIAEQIEWCHVHGGGVLFRQGDEGDSLYMVVSGRLRVVLEKADGSGIVRTLREVTRGDTVGELALIIGEKRSATVVALRDTELGRLSREAFAHLLEQEPRSVLGLTRMLARWLSDANNPLPPPVHSPTTITIVALRQQGPLAKFAANLVAALGRVGPTLHLNSTIVEQILGEGTSQAGEGDESYAGTTLWLNDQEGDYRFIVYEGDVGLTAWTLRCLSQADRILQVADSSEPLEQGKLPGPRGSAGVIGGGADQELVLLHQGQTPQGTELWLAQGDFSTHHHIRGNVAADYDRLARHLSGTAVGLVLGGGGARGFAHIGVIRALEEAGIPIDRLGGTSMGAVIAAQYAGGLTPAEMMDLNRRGWIGYRPHRDYTLPLISLLSGRAAGRMLKMMFGNQSYEDLWLNCFCVSTNLSRAELMVHRSGSVRRWLRASIAMPGSAPPLIGDHGDLLVDGGVLDNVPVATMRQLGESAIVAVDVSPHVDLVADSSLKLAPSPWEILRNRFRHKDTRGFPSLYQLIYRTSVLASIRAGKQGRGEVALYLEPPVRSFDTFEMDSIDAIVEAGYRYTMERLADRNFRLPPTPPA